MAVTNNLLIFAAETSNKMDDATYLAASQRISGAQANQVISSSLHNTVMRSSTLILKALVDSLITNSTLSEGSISTNSAENVVKALFDSLFSGFKATNDQNGDNIAQTYGVDISKSVDSSTDIITLQLLAKTAHGEGEPTRIIGNGVQIETVAKSKALEASETDTDADYKLLMRPSGSASGVASKYYYGQNNNVLFNPKTGKMTVKQVNVGTQFGNFGTCTTTGNTVAKTVSISNFVLQTGAHIFVKFSNEHTNSTAPTLNVNSTGAKAIVQYGTTSAGVGVQSSWCAGEMVEFVYDGTYWVMVGRRFKVSEAVLAGKADKLTGFDASWTPTSWLQGWSTNGFPWDLGDVYEMRVYRAHANNKYSVTQLGIITMTSSPSDQSITLYTPAFASPADEGTAAPLWRLKFCYRVQSGGSVMMIEQFSPSNGIWSEISAPYAFYVYTRKVQNN